MTSLPAEKLEKEGGSEGAKWKITLEKQALVASISTTVMRRNYLMFSLNAQPIGGYKAPPPEIEQMEIDAA